MAASVSADETEALKAEITKAVEKVQEAGKTGASQHYKNMQRIVNNGNSISDMVWERSII